jgi:hypothetical protein
MQESRVDVTLMSDTEWFELTVEDDGAGIAKDVANSFGQRRKHRILGDSAGANLSLGLGSVILLSVP